MSPIFPHLPVDLGIYTLTKLLGSHETYDRYIARQSHVERAVVIEVLRPDCSKETLDAFLSSARVRVAARLPYVSQVLETMVSGNIWYITSECPEGVPLSRLKTAKKRLSAPKACTILQRVGVLYDYCARKKLTAEALTADAIFLTKEGKVTFLSPLVAGAPSPELHGRQLDALADVLRDVSPMGEAGQTRIATLLEWLGQEFDGQRMEWQAVSSTAEFIRESISPLLTKEKLYARPAETPYARKRRLRHRRRLMLQYGLLAVVCLLCMVGISMSGLLISPLIPAESVPAVQGRYVRCRARAGEILVMRSPVSIREYRKFLEAYDGMSAGERNAVNKGLPSTEPDHTPAEWSQQLRAAGGDTKWRGLGLTMQSPVRGISYWDALAYANYRHAFLPTTDMLYTARLATDSNTVAEWTGTLYDGNVIYSRSHVILPGKNGTSPVFEADPAKRDVTRSFRLFFPATSPDKP